MDFEVSNIHADICGNDAFFVYEGDVASCQINSILEMVEEKLVASEANNKQKRKILNILVEGLQNLFHHSDDVPEELTVKLGDRYGMVVITKNIDNYRLSMGNFVLTDRVKFLTEKIEKINSMSEEELKDMYKFILNYQKLSAKGGGGLGLIDMARKSDNKLGFKFYPFNEKYYFFRLDIFVTI